MCLITILVVSILAHLYFQYKTYELSIIIDVECSTFLCSMKTFSYAFPDEDPIDMLKAQSKDVFATFNRINEYDRKTDLISAYQMPTT